MQKETVTLEVQPEMLSADKISSLETISRKLDAEIWKQCDTGNQRNVIDWSSRMTSYEIALIRQAILVFQNLIYRYNIQKQPTMAEKRQAEKQKNEDQET